MMDKTQKRWSFIVNVIYFAIFLGAFYLFMKYAFWTFTPFMVALVIAAILQKPLKFLTKSKKSPKGLISSLLSLLVFAVLFGAVALGGVWVVSSIKDLITYFTDRCSNLVEFFEVLKNAYLNLDIVDKLPPEINDAVLNGIDYLSDYFMSGKIVTAITDNISKIIVPISGVISTVPSVVLGVIISVVATCFMTSSFEDIKQFVLRQIPKENRNKAIKAKKILISSLGKMMRAYAAIILITTCELSLGLYILKLIGVNDGSHIIIISFLIALIDIVPVLGTGTVIIPWSIYSLVTGNIGMGVGLLIMYAVITVVRQIIEPKLVAGQVGISPVVTIISMYVGIKLFGAIGIFILPFFVIIVKLLNDEGIIHLFNSKPEDINKFEKAEQEAAEKKNKKRKKGQKETDESEEIKEDNEINENNEIKEDDMNEETHENNDSDKNT